ncbi:glycosyltransferase family 2 protein [Streptomyces sp. V3I7]|uniref:glycosyltransferase family 2 protein n=1 Tax=Streptomyces sp. V3I7 TaxID=3042278 RepID=UPI0027842FE5|nr:glycosyltransferase [Streptomyces sp. V3I7]MDQ0994645.1 GT2 family glycosyltransferase [Streptomyces sp. V3I7]
MNGQAPRPRTGIVVITRNRCGRLLRTLDLLTHLPGQPPIAVVDNGSTDGTAEAVRRTHPRVRLLTPGRNLAAAGRTYGAAALDTPYVAFSDDDSWWEPDSLERAADILDGHPRVGLLSATTLVGDEARQDPLNTALRDSPLGTEPGMPGPSVLGFLACAAVVRREAFLGVGGFHPLLRIGGEEQLLAIDLDAAGWGVVHCPDVVARHQPDGAPRPGRHAVMRRNALLTAWLRRPLRDALSQTACLLVDGVTDAGARHALAGAAWRLPAALKDRRPVPRRVERRIHSVEASP